MSAPRERKGERFGELTIIKRVGTMTYAWAGQDVNVSAYLCGCPKGHREIRSLASLRATGELTKCKRCRAKNRMNRLTMFNPPRRRGK